MATVKGDVHDIGKNIVGVVLACNNYEVIDLGVMVPVEKILTAAKEHSVDIIGLSGLITPSLDEMVHVAKEMERQQLSYPILIGGATTSRKHTAVKIAPSYSGPVIHVEDASRSVPVVSSLLSPEGREPFLANIKAEYETIRTDHFAREKQREYCSLEEARKNRLKIDFMEHPPIKPKSLGVTVIDNAPLDVIAEYIDWTPFFMTWDLKGAYPDIFQSPKVGQQARQLYDDARSLLQRIIEERRISARGVIGLFPANAVGDDINLYLDDSRKTPLATLHTLRQQTRKRDDNPNIALSDFIAPLDTGIPDYIGMFAVTTGIGMEDVVQEFEKELDDYNAIMVKALADRLAEAFAEFLHGEVRKLYWGYAEDETLTSKQLIREKYQGIRPAAGYPACPDHTEKATIFNLLNAEKNASIHLTESYAMFPGASVSGLYFAHPRSHYFGLGKVGRDQIEDYSRRKGQSLQETERWLEPNLNYLPKTS